MNLRTPDLTGRIGCRFGLFGRLVVQVEYRVPSESPGSFECDWKDATINELIQAMKMEGKSFAAKE